MLELHQKTRPAASSEKRARKQKTAKKRFYRKPGFYAGFVAALGVLAAVLIGITYAGVSQTTNIDTVMQLAEDDSAQALAEETGVNPQWIDFLSILQDNVAVIVLGVIGVAFLLAFFIVAGSEMMKRATTRGKKRATSTDDRGTTRHGDD